MVAKSFAGLARFPGVVGRSTERAGARHVIGGHFDRLLKVASRNA
jgi:hypothetical protein